MIVPLYQLIAKRTLYNIPIGVKIFLVWNEYALRWNEYFDYNALNYNATPSYLFETYTPTQHKV